MKEGLGESLKECFQKYKIKLGLSQDTFGEIKPEHINESATNPHSSKISDINIICPITS